MRLEDAMSAKPHTEIGRAAKRVVERPSRLRRRG